MQSQMIAIYYWLSLVSLYHLKMTLKKVYKNVFFDEDRKQYFFVDNNDKILVKDQVPLLQIYMIEILLSKEN